MYFINESQEMRFESFANFSIFRPRDSSEYEIRIASERNLRSTYPVGIYKEKVKINEIIQHQFTFYLHKLKQLVPLVASRNFLEFVLHEYEIASDIEELYKSEVLNYHEKNQWEEIGAVFRKAAKYVAELTTQLNHLEAPLEKDSYLLLTTEKLWICAEEIISLYIVSEQTHSIFSQYSELEILPAGSNDFLQHRLTIDISAEKSRTYLDLRNRDRFMPKPIFLLDIEKHDEVLGQVFKDQIGVTYQEAIGILEVAIERSSPPPNGFPIPFINKKKLIETLSETFSFSSHSVETVIEGFLISKEKMELEKREVWNPKQEYRAFSRGFFEYIYQGEKHIVFSKAMARECLIGLFSNTSFKKLPSEWLSPKISKTLDTLGNEVGKWFEHISVANLIRCGFIGSKSIKKLKISNEILKLPKGVGEIDYIGYSDKENILLICECKMVRFSFEPKFFRDDIHDFITSSHSYIKKFRSKVEWVRANLYKICESNVIEIDKIKAKTLKVGGIIITFFPTIASNFIDDYPCVSLTEFMVDYESMHKYPYEIGIVDSPIKPADA